MTTLFEAFSEINSHLQTIESLLLSAKETATNQNMQDMIDALDERWQECKTLASSIDEMENALEC